MTTTQTRDEREFVPVVPEVGDERDIYAVLGVHPSASPRVIQEMYWMRVSRLRDAERSGDASAPIEIEALSAALSVAWSPERRSAYDKQRHLTGEAPAPARRSPLAFVRFPLELLLSLLVAAVVLVVHSPAAAALALAGALAVAVGVRQLRRRPALKGTGSAFALLQIRPTDDIAEIERAYSAVSQTLLARLRHDDAALEELDALDRAFARAITTAEGPRVEVATLSELGDRMEDEPPTSQATRPHRPAAERRRSLDKVVTASRTLVVRGVVDRLVATAIRLSVLVRCLAVRGQRGLANVGRAAATQGISATQLGIHWASARGRAGARRVADGLVELRSSKPGLRPTTRAVARAARWLVSAALASLRVSRPVLARALRRGAIELRCLPARTSTGAKWSARTIARAWRWSRAREQELRPLLRSALAEARTAVIVGSLAAARFARRSGDDGIRASLAARSWVQKRRDEGIPGHSVTLPPPVDSPSLSTDVRRRLAGMGPAAQAPARPGLSQSDGEAPAQITCRSPAGVVRVAVSDAPISVGAASTCDLVLDAAFGIAPEHAVLWRRGDDLILHVTTFGATCEVNGKPARWASLDDGDVVAMGEVQLTVERRAELAS